MPEARTNIYSKDQLWEIVPHQHLPEHVKMITHPDHPGSLVVVSPEGELQVILSGQRILFPAYFPVYAAADAIRGISHGMYPRAGRHEGTFPQENAQLYLGVTGRGISELARIPMHGYAHKFVAHERFCPEVSDYGDLLMPGDCVVGHRLHWPGNEIYPIPHVIETITGITAAGEYIRLQIIRNTSEEVMIIGNGEHLYFAFDGGIPALRDTLVVDDHNTVLGSFMHYEEPETDQHSFVIPNSNSFLIQSPGRTLRVRVFGEYVVSGRGHVWTEMPTEEATRASIAGVVAANNAVWGEGVFDPSLMAEQVRAGTQILTEGMAFGCVEIVCPDFSWPHNDSIRKAKILQPGESVSYMVTIGLQ